MIGMIYKKIYDFYFYFKLIIKRDRLIYNINLTF